MCPSGWIRPALRFACLCVAGGLLGAGLGACDGQEATTPADEEPDEAAEPVPRTIDLSGALGNVHDPAPIQAHGRIYLYSTLCRSATAARESTATTTLRVGRSRSVTGPYVDKEGTPMTDGGGTLVLDGWPGWKGPGHNAMLTDGGETLLVYHAYSVAQDGTPMLRLSPLEWEDGWPLLPTTDRP